MSWFDSFLGGGWVGPAILGTAVVASSAIASSANDAAAERASQAAQAQADAIREGNTLAQQRYETTRAETKPALDYQMGRIAGANQLTPQQQDQLGEVRRQSLAALSVSGLRGSGRAAVAATRRSEADFTNNAINENRRAADSAAGGLANQYYRANDNAALTDQRTGAAVGQAEYQGGMTDAASGLANATLRGRAIGDIAGIINEGMKEGRRSGYATQRPSEDETQKSMGAG